MSSTCAIALIWLLAALSHQKVFASDKKGCQLNDVLIHEQIFPNFACWKCYETFSASVGRLVKVNCGIRYDGKNSSVPGFVVGEHCVPFDHRTKSISKLVQSSLPSGTFERWKRCCNDAVECCDAMISSYQVENFFNACDNHWDGSSCYHDTFPGRSVSKVCPYQVSKGDSSKCHHFTTKECLPNGTWDQPDYSQCFPSKRLQTNIAWHVAIISVSLILCVPPMFVFVIRKEVRSKSLTMIVVLIAVICFRNLLMLTTKTMLLIDPTILYQNLWPCKLTTVLAQLADTFAYFFLLLIGLSLRDVIFNHSEGCFKVVLPMIPLGLVAIITVTIAWTLTMQFTADELCWQLDMENSLHWINDAPRLVMLLMTTYFVFKILRHKNESTKTPGIYIDALFTTKLVTLSFPFFWLPFVIMLFESIHNTCGWEELNKFLMISCEALQLVVLSFIFFAEPRVRKIFKNFDRRHFCRKKISSQDSDASLAPSKISGNSLCKEEAYEPINSWNDFVIRARSSVCEGNLYTIEPHSPISTSPDPPPAKNRTSLVLKPPRSNQIKTDTTRRHAIRDIMWRAKNNVPKGGSVTSLTPTAAKCVTPPLPKNIPNQILDDVQLFDFYYKNLNSIFINDDSPPNVVADDTESNSSSKRMSRLLSFAGDKPMTCAKISSIMTDDERNCVIVTHEVDAK